MPEDADREPPLGILDRLDGAVVGPRHLAQAVADPPEGLMVVRLHVRGLGAHERTELRRLVDPYIMVRELPYDRAVLLVPDRVGQVLHEVSAAGDVQHLEAPA